MQPHRIWCVTWFPALRAKLQRTRLFDGDPFCRCLQVGLGDIQGIGQPAFGLGLEHRRVAALNLADALGVDAGLVSHCLLTHAEG